MSFSCRTFPGGANTDNLKAGSGTAPTTTRSAAIWMNITAYDGTNAAWDWRNAAGTILADSLFALSGAPGLLVAIGWSTTNGNWTVGNPGTGAWHHILWTYDGSNINNTPVVYFDGVSQTVTLTQTPVGTLQSGSTPQIVGNNSGSAQCWHGSLFGYARWNSVLVQADATALAGGTPPCAVQPANLTAYYPLDAGQSPEPDLVANNNATVTGTTVGTGPTVPYTRCVATLGAMPRQRLYPYNQSPQPIIAPAIPPAVKDQAKAGVSPHWDFRQNFAPVVNRQLREHWFDAPVKDQPRPGQVNTHWPYTSWTTVQYGTRGLEEATDRARGWTNPGWPLTAFRPVVPGGVPNDQVQVVITPDGSVGGINRTWRYPGYFPTLEMLQFTRPFDPSQVVVVPLPPTQDLSLDLGLHIHGLFLC